MRYDDLAGLSPVVRKEVLTGDLSRRVKDLGTVDTPDVDHVVDSLVSLSLRPDIIDTAWQQSAQK